MNRKPEQILDELIVLRAQAGDRDSIEQLVNNWNNRFIRYSAQIISDKELAADAVQESWISILKGLRKLKDPATFKSWAYRIVHNKSYDAIRNNIKRKTARNDLARISKSETETNEPPDQLDDVKMLKTAIAELKLEDRQVLTLFYDEDLSLKEIQKITGHSISALKSRLHNVRQRLRTTLERKNNG